MTDINALQIRFQELYGLAPTIVSRAPGRVNLIGEHTDYNDGFVFPAALDFDVAVAATPRPDRQVRIYSLTFRQPATFSLDALEHSPEAPWSNYVRGVAKVLQETGRTLPGLNCVIDGTVPIGSGLSSSAAIEVSSCLAFEAAGGFTLEPVPRALLCQKAEHWVGTLCGIMDQFISVLGRRDHALLIDTRSLDYEAVPLPSGLTLALCDTQVRHELAGPDAAYNERRAQCEEAVRILRGPLPHIKALRDVSVADLAAHGRLLPPVVLRRARHVVTEDARTLAGAEALKAGDIARFGEILNAGHASLRDDFEVSCPQSDAMVEIANGVSGCYGARQTGGGFGGTVVALVRDDAVAEFRRIVPPAYKAATGLDMRLYAGVASDGARRIL